MKKIMRLFIIWIVILLINACTTLNKTHPFNNEPIHTTPDKESKTGLYFGSDVKPFSIQQSYTLPISELKTNEPFNAPKNFTYLSNVAPIRVTLDKESKEITYYSYGSPLSLLKPRKLVFKLTDAEGKLISYSTLKSSFIFNAAEATRTDMTWLVKYLTSSYSRDMHIFSGTTYLTLAWLNQYNSDLVNTPFSAVDHAITNSISFMEPLINTMDEMKQPERINKIEGGARTAQPISAPPTPAKKPLKLPNTSAESILESYSVTVAANDKLTIPGPPGELKVWIGISSKAPQIQPGMVTETKELEAVGKTAKIKPFALGIDVDPTESICPKIDSTGSEARFKLIPKEEGKFTVGADVELYDSNNCTGAPIPKSAKSVTVTVTIANERVIKRSTSEFISTTWKIFIDFWEKLLLLAFALLLFLIRKKLSKLFGFKEKE